MELLHYPAIPLWGTYQKELKTRSQRDYLHTHIHSSIITITKRWWQFKCPSMDEWINIAPHCTGSCSLLVQCFSRFLWPSLLGCIVHPMVCCLLWHRETHCPQEGAWAHTKLWGYNWTGLKGCDLETLMLLPQENRQEMRILAVYWWYRGMINFS